MVRERVDAGSGPGSESEGWGEFADPLEKIYGFLVEAQEKAATRGCTCPPGHDVCAMRAALFEAAGVMVENGALPVAVMLLVAFQAEMESAEPTPAFVAAAASPFFHGVLKTMRTRGLI